MEESDGCANCDWSIGSCIHVFEKYAGTLPSYLKYPESWSAGTFRNFSLLLPRIIYPSKFKPFKPEIPQ